MYVSIQDMLELYDKELEVHYLPRGNLILMLLATVKIICQY